MPVSYANQGLTFDNMIELSNKMYATKGWATIQKVQTPWSVVRNGKKIISAFPEEKSSVDYIGVFNGRAIAFDAKSTVERTRFPLSNIEDNEFYFLTNWRNNGGISFILVEFTKLQETYLVLMDDFEIWWNEAKGGGRKNIPYEWFLLNCNLVKSKNGILLDYLIFFQK